MKKFLKITTMVIVCIILGLSLISYKVSSAKSLVRNLCINIKPNDPVDEILLKIKTSDFDRIEEPKLENGNEKIIAMANGFILIRFSCSIEYKNGKVISASYYSIY